MNKEKSLAVRENQTAVAFSQEEIETIKNTVAKEATDTELKLFLHQCKRTGLDPFSRQIYFLKMGGKASIQSSIDGFRLIAERSGKYQGQTIPQYIDATGKWHEVWVDNGYPVAAKVGVYRSDFKEPLYAIAKWDSYCPMYQGRPGTMWAKMPEVMLAKVAEALALRKAFPNDLSGIYAAEEMAQAETPAVQTIKHIQHEDYNGDPIEAEAVVQIDEPQDRTAELKAKITEHLAELGMKGKTKKQIHDYVSNVTKLDSSKVENYEEIEHLLGILASDKFDASANIGE